MRRLIGLWVLCLVLVACTQVSPRPAVAAQPPQRPFPQHRVYAEGTLRPGQFTQAEQDDDVRAYYDDWKAHYVIAAGTTPGGVPRYRISIGSTNPARTVSEGQGYGMLIVALMAGYDPQAQTIFDGLWEFARAYPSDIDPRLMGWQIPVVPGSNDSAFDGDADIAYALLLADAQWGSAGRINYRTAAENVIAGILESTIGPESRLPLLGDWVDANGAISNQYTPRSSDFMPAHFRAYGRATGDPVWDEVVAACQTVITHLQTEYSPDTGLLPDFIVPVSVADHTPQPAPPEFLEGPDDGHYYYNAFRDPWRIGTDALLNGDPVSLTQSRKLSQWAETIAGGDPAALRAGYRLDGVAVPGSDYFTIIVAAPLGVAAMTGPAQQAWLDSLYAAVRDAHEDYYEDTVTLLSLLIMTGNYWDPTAQSAAASLYLPLLQSGHLSPAIPN